MSFTEDNVRAFLTRLEAARSSGYEELLAKEFQDVRIKAVECKKDNNFSTKFGENPENLKKNRYKDILPYDQTRVAVTLLAEEAESDYINANFIQGPDKKPRYIATQGPLAHTVLDFWKMIWQYNVKVIVMACREVEQGKRRCERYWAPDEGSSQYGPFTISTTEKTPINAEIVWRRLKVTFQEEVREVNQFQYVAWPDHGIPDSYTCFLEMIQVIRQTQGDAKTPMCVHCSAGCGRTGVICTVEYIQCLLDQQMVPSDFSIYEVVLEMRRQRPSAVQTKEQYDFLYHAVTEMFEKQLQKTQNYENLTKNKAPFYDDVGSLATDQQTLTDPRRVLRESASLPLDYQSPSHTEHFTRSPPNMNETYAVIRKPRPAAAMPPSVPQVLPTSQTTQYDNINHPMTAPIGPLYSIVAPKPNHASAHATSPSSGPISSYSYAEMPGLADAPTAGCTHVSVPRTVDTNSYSNSCSTKGDNKRWPHSQNECSASFAKNTSSLDDYEDVNDPSKGNPAVATGGLGFNCRIAKPKGPRDPPAEWSR